MSDQPDNILLIYLRRLDQGQQDMRDLKLLMTNLEENMAGMNRRLDRVEQRLDRIERRLDLVEPIAR